MIEHVDNLTGSRFWINCTAHIDWSQVPLLSNVENLADDGIITGASDRNWQSYGSDVGLPASFTPAQLALLTDPQTSGGLLIAVAPEAIDELVSLLKENNIPESCLTPIGRVISKVGEWEVVF